MTVIYEWQHLTLVERTSKGLLKPKKRMTMSKANRKWRNDTLLQRDQEWKQHLQQVWSTGQTYKANQMSGQTKLFVGMQCWVYLHRIRCKTHDWGSCLQSAKTPKHILRSCHALVWGILQTGPPPSPNRTCNTFVKHQESHGSLKSHSFTSDRHKLGEVWERARRVGWWWIQE